MLIEFEINSKLSIGLVLFLLFKRLEQVADAVCGKCRLAQNTHNFKYRSADFEVMLNDGNEAIGDNCDMYLYADGILAFSPESLDLKMLLDPLEEQLHLPSVLIEQSDILGTEVEVVRVVGKTPVQFWRIVDNSSDCAWILFLVFFLGKTDALVFENIILSVENTFSTDNLVKRLALFPDDKECLRSIDSVESGKVKVSSVKDIAGQWFICEPVHRVDIMHLSVGDSVEHRYFRGDINLRMDFDAGLGTSEFCPSEDGHAEVNRSRVNGVESAVQFKILGKTTGLCHSHHIEGKLLKDTMVSERISLGEHLSVDGLAAKTEMFGFPTMGGRNICKFPEASTAHELTKHQHQHVAPVRHRPSPGPVVVLGNYTSELPLRDILCYLYKTELSYMHICSDLYSDAKVSISKPGQGIRELKYCA